ncbi:MAG: phenylalanine--tRNA ligase subunit alpha [Chloroflexi bacterium]|nr:phenylalanine--tRNA ligase subunit alpha [Chloroflexota bacterium]
MIEELKNKSLTELESVKSVDSLEQWRVKYLGRKGELTSILRGIGSLPDNERRLIGSQSNSLRGLLEEQYKKIKPTLEKNLTHDSVDITLPGRTRTKGRLHPITSIIREISEAFSDMGFSIVEGNESELEHYNFDLLNIPKDHPARDQWDTIWLDRPNRDDNLLRTHTSPMQARIMENSKPPIRVIIPGKCYRYEATDATHEWHFHQIEGLVVGKNISFSDLKGTLYELARRIFGPSRKVRFRCDFFPFVEPGVDMSIDWKGEWIEILGAGMVHPKVFEGVGYDPNVYSGFAFGMGPERIAMLRYDIEDIRQFFSNDLRFLSQF